MKCEFCCNANGMTRKKNIKQHWVHRIFYKFSEIHPNQTLRLMHKSWLSVLSVVINHWSPDSMQHEWIQEYKILLKKYCFDATTHSSFFQLEFYIAHALLFEEIFLLHTFDYVFSHFIHSSYCSIEYSFRASCFVYHALNVFGVRFLVLSITSFHFPIVNIANTYVCLNATHLTAPFPC